MDSSVNGGPLTLKLMHNTICWKEKMIITSNKNKITVIILSIIYKLYKSNQQVTKDILISSRNLRDYTQ